jgi:hypothetical protein
MSSYQVIGAVDLTLRDLLWSEMQFDSVITGILSNESQISLEPPAKLLKDTEVDTNTLSLFLYKVNENPELKNRYLQVIDSHTQVYPPLALNLYYLLTPLTNSADNDHTLLGKALQIFYRHSLVKGSILKGVLAGTDLQLSIILNPISLDELSNLWSAFLRPYRLSVSYEVKIVFIDSDRETTGERVLEKRINVGVKNS